MFIIQWLCDDPIRVIPASFICIALLAVIQYILSIKVKNKVVKFLPIIPIALLSVLDLLLALGVFGTRSDGLDNVHLLVATILAIPLFAMYVGLLMGWLTAVLHRKLKQRKEVSL